MTTTTLEKADGTYGDCRWRLPDDAFARELFRSLCPASQSIVVVQDYIYAIDDGTKRLSAAVDRWRIVSPLVQGLPELHGSPKQIAWAERIRREVVARLAMPYVKLVSAQAVNLARLIEWVVAHDEAAWWIDNRSDGAVRTDLPVINTDGVSYRRYTDRAGQHLEHWAQRAIAAGALSLTDYLAAFSD